MIRSPADDTTPEHRAPRRRLNLLIVLLASVGVVQLIYLNLVEVDRTLVLQRDVNRLEADVARLEAEEFELREVAAHAFDLGYREQLARRQGFIGKDELRVVTAPSGGPEARP